MITDVVVGGVDADMMSGSEECDGTAKTFMVDFGDACITADGSRLGVTGAKVMAAGGSGMSAVSAKMTAVGGDMGTASAKMTVVGGGMSDASTTVADGCSGMSAASAKVTTVGGGIGAASTKVLAVGGGLDAATAHAVRSSSYSCDSQLNVAEGQ